MLMQTHQRICGWGPTSVVSNGSCVLTHHIWYLEFVGLSIVTNKIGLYTHTDLWNSCQTLSFHTNSPALRYVSDKIINLARFLIKRLCHVGRHKLSVDIHFVICVIRILILSSDWTSTVCYAPFSIKSCRNWIFNSISVTVMPYDFGSKFLPNSMFRSNKICSVWIFGKLNNI